MTLPQQLNRAFAAMGFPAPKLGTRLEKALAKVPGVKKLPCYENGKLKPGSPCKKKSRWLDGE